MQKVTIRPWQASDLTSCANIASLASGDGAWPLSLYKSSFQGASFGLVAKAPDQAGVVGDVVGVVVGQVVMDEVELHDIQVLPLYQGNGVAAMLFKEFVEHALSEGAASVFLEVRKSNARARAFYRKLGFVQLGVRRQYYPPMGGTPAEDALILRLEV